MDLRDIGQEVAFAFRRASDEVAGSVTRGNNMLEIRPRTKRRESLMQLRPHHLATVEHIAKRGHYHRASQHDFMLENYNSIFGGGLRPKAKTVPSDRFRRSWMISEMLDLVEARRSELGK